MDYRNGITRGAGRRPIVNRPPRRMLGSTGPVNVWDSERLATVADIRREFVPAHLRNQPDHMRAANEARRKAYRAPRRAA